VWLTTDLALHVGYHVESSSLGVRIGHLDVDPLSSGPPSDSAAMASTIFHNLHDAPDDLPWEDASGRGWWGDEPAEGWAAIEQGRRILTLT
jgi:hypothetical protein